MVYLQYIRSDVDQTISSRLTTEDGTLLLRWNVRIAPKRSKYWYWRHPLKLTYCNISTDINIYFLFVDSITCLFETITECHCVSLNKRSHLLHVVKVCVSYFKWTCCLSQFHCCGITGAQEYSLSRFFNDSQFSKEPRNVPVTCCTRSNIQASP